MRVNLIARARKLGINLSEALERSLEEELRVRERKGWLEENERAFSEYDERVRKKGVFSDFLRKF